MQTATNDWAVVTGAASGLGLAIAKELRRDCNLLLIDSDVSALHLAWGRMPSTCRVELVEGDVSQPQTWARARDCLDGAVPRWLVQCAGIAVSGTVAEAPIEHWRKALEINFLGLVLGCRTFSADMARMGRGHIINIASRAAITSVPSFGPYTASKAAVVAMSETLHNEIGEQVTITVACPSYFRSNLVDRMIAQNEVERTALERRISSSSRSADDLAPAILQAATRGDLYYLPPGEDRRMWRLKRLMPVRTLKLVRDKVRRALRASESG